MRGRSFGATDIGRVRPKNEDFFAVEPSIGFFAVADGLGGRRAGDAASRGAIEIMTRYLKERLRFNSSVKRALLGAYKTAARYVYEISHNNPATRGAMTTLTAMLLRGGRYHIVHIGDTRAYLLRRGKLRQITEDHTQAQLFVKQGYLTPEEARHHKSRNILTKALGTRPFPKPSYYSNWVKKGDKFLLASDGLYTHFEDRELAEILASYSPREAVQRLIELANDRGGDDNITAVVVEIIHPGVNWLMRVIYRLDRVLKP